VYPAQPPVELQRLQQESALEVICAALIKFVPSLFLPGNLLQLPKAVPFSASAGASAERSSAAFMANSRTATNTIRAKQKPREP
jgi:hypothetical protein